MNGVLPPDIPTSDYLVVPEVRSTISDFATRSDAAAGSTTRVANAYVRMRVGANPYGLTPPLGRSASYRPPSTSAHSVYTLPHLYILDIPNSNTQVHSIHIETQEYLLKIPSTFKNRRAHLEVVFTSNVAIRDAAPKPVPYLLHYITLHELAVRVDHALYLL